MKLRPYQDDCIRTVESRGDGRWLCQLATGLGKTVIFANLPRHGRVLVLSHRRELVFQPIKYFDCPVGVELGAKHKSDGEEVVTASVQTMVKRLEKFNREHFHTIIVDEAHHSAADTYGSILSYFTPNRVLGFTATPNRGDGQALDSEYDDIIFEYDLRRGIQDGWLCDIDCRRIDVEYDLSDVHTRMGDFSQSELEKAVNITGANKAIAEAVRNLSQGQTLIFSVSVPHAEAVAAEIPGAVALSAKSKDRDLQVERFKRGEFRVLVNCALFTEGTDIPNVETVIIARPTQSAALYTQMVGRGTRLFKGKNKCLLIDCVGNTGRHNLCTAPTLIGLDLLTVPEREYGAIEGDLLSQLPELIARKSDCPETWIKNVQIVNLWARKTGYVLHDLNWIKLPDGSLKIPLINGKFVMVSAPDLAGKCVLKTNTGYVSEPLKAQQCYDLALNCLRTHFADSSPLWNLKSIGRWGKEPASDKQKTYVVHSARRKGIVLDPAFVAGLTKHQAGLIIERLKQK